MDFDLQTQKLKKGQTISGVVVLVEPNTIYLDVQSYTEGKIHLDNYSKPELETFVGNVNEGDIIEAVVQKTSHDPELILLSRLPLLREANQKKIYDLMKSKEVVEGKVKKVIPKGLIVDYLGTEILIPSGFMEKTIFDQGDELLNTNISFNILKEEKRGRFTNIIGTRRQIIKEERERLYQERLELRQEELESINTGDVLEGVVNKLERHAATVKFNHVVGLLRISQVSHHRIEKIEDVLTVGDVLNVKVIKKEGNRLDLSLKALEATPFEKYVETHKRKQTVAGKVFQKLPFGIIVELAEGVRGLLHKNEYSWNPDDNFQDFVKIGDEIEVMIDNFDKDKERISLSRKALEDNPWKNVTVKRNDKVTAPIIEIDRDGLLVEVQGVNAIIPINELSNERIGKPEDHFEVGQEVTAVVTEVNTSRWILKLSIKKLEAQVERKSFEQYLSTEEDSENVTIGDLFGKDLKNK